MKIRSKNIFSLLCYLFVAFIMVTAITRPAFADPAPQTASAESQAVEPSDNESCKYSELKTKYMEGSTCWYCLVVGKMTSAYLYSASLIIPTVKTISLLILRYGFLIWLALYILKQVSSLSPISTGKFLQEILLMGFKVLFATLVVTNAIPFLNEYLLTPIIDTGIDVGNAIFDVMSKDFDLDNGGAK